MKKKQKKSNAFIKFLRILLIIFLVLILLFAALFTFSDLDKKDPLSVIPQDYSLYLHTDSVWDSVIPLLDLQAADIFLSSPNLADFRGLFMNFRSSNLRSSKILGLLASRPVSATLYTSNENSAQNENEEITKKQDFVAIADLGFLSAATRALPVYKKLLPKQVVCAENHYEYKLKKATLYIKPIKNLVVIASSLNYLNLATENDNSVNFSAEQRSNLLRKNEKSIRLLANTQKIAETFTEGNELLSKVTSVLTKNELSEVSFEIADGSIQFQAKLPFELTEESKNTFGPLLNKKSSMPILLARLGDSVQYYTTINAGSFEQLKTSLFPLLPANKKPDELWKKANSMCKMLFSSSLEDILFSWTGQEFAALGIRGHNDPIFAIQIKDEIQRQHIFEKIFSSILIKNDDSLILNGIRLPQLLLPGFINSVLSLFNINIPFPYYVEHDGFIYFSENPECLCKLINSMQNGSKLSNTQNWKDVSSEQKTESTISLFYDLEHSMPFFLRGQSTLSQILKLYSIGRCDIRIEDSAFELQLQAIARSSGDLSSIPGFPISLDKNIKTDYTLLAQSESTTNTIFWLENSTTIKALDVSSTKVFSFTMPEACSIKEAPKKLSNNGVLWAVTKNGVIYLFDSKLNPIKKFPLLSGEKNTEIITVTTNNLIIPLKNGNILFVDEDANISTVELSVMGNIKSAPKALENNVALYYKGFIGEIFFIENGICTNADTPELVDGIAFGSPAMLKINDDIFTAFITQNGTLYLWKNGVPVLNKVVKLNNIFNVNVVASNNCFYALGSDATLYKIQLDGSYLAVKIPNRTAKSGHISVCKNFRNNSCGIFVCPDSNTLYGFTESLELISGFPLVGYGIPVFADANGDKNLDCITFSIDNKINAWNLR